MSDRGTSPVAGTRKTIMTRGRVLCGLLAFTGVVAIWAFYKTANPPEEPTNEKVPERVAVFVPYKPLDMPVTPAPAQPPGTPAAAPVPGITPVAASTPLITPRREPASTWTPNVAGPVVIKPNMLSFAMPAAAQPPSDRQDGSGNQPAGAVSYAGSHASGVQAELEGDTTFVIEPGLLAATLDTAIDSTFDGPIQAHIPFDVRPHGITLLSRNSIITGYYSNRIQNGQTRLQMVTEEIRDPATGCFITVDNMPFADAQGRSGVPGNVDNRWPERIGGAVMFTFAESAMNVLQAAVSKGGNSYLSLNSGGGIGGLSQDLLALTRNIPPLITKHPGEPVAVYIRKRLDFSKCYSLLIKDRRNVSR